MPSPVHPYSEYGVALRTLKSARSWLGFMLILCVATQFIGFALMWWTPQPYEGMKGRWKNSPTENTQIVDDLREWIASQTQPAATPAVPTKPPPVSAFFPGTDESRRLNIRKQWDVIYTMAVPVTQLAGLIAISSQAIIIFVTLLVLLIAQAPGVAQMTRSFIWSVLVLFMFLPWQYFAHNFPIPGVIYSYSELLRMIGPQVAGDNPPQFEMWLVYGRFLVWPLVGLLALLITSERFRAGVTLAIGHPLQSMFQPRSAGVSPLPPLLATQPRPMPTPKITGTR